MPEMQFLSDIESLVGRKSKPRITVRMSSRLLQLVRSAIDARIPLS